MYILIVSSSLDPNSRSRTLAKECEAMISNLGMESQFIDLAEINTPSFDNDSIYKTQQYKILHELTSNAAGIVLCSPIYNWGCCAELKKYIECVGSTNENVTGALFDKIITFVNSAGLPHSYMAHTHLANSLMLDFKCIINPYNIYAHERHWIDEKLTSERHERVVKSMKVKVELCELLSSRTYSSEWEI
ncbi:NADPH-dependent FMN reductase [uncultured Vibrio sp.]|uniref:NADPH-dependent FMN reductase n=1 Tax=uncultured Vibrio sp. TaxID=114054 RepID=UPI0025FD9A2B|nr:NAD(P)H-dependent oxidoreductase [uncultured Vibrio sp.]